jgi:cation diffusion facilitator family transporter
MLRNMPVRRSTAALERERKSDSRRTILIALAANVLIAAAKLVAGLMTGSTALLAESAHSAADSINEILLGISLRRARRPADATHPFGHGRERFLWAFMAAIASFLIGGCLSIGMAIRELRVSEAERHALVGWIVLAISFGADGISWLQSMRQARDEARKRGRSVWQHLRHSSEPLLRAIVVEDSAALVGLLLAAAGLLFSHLAGNNRPDAFASLLIGILLALTAFGLARPLADLLIGRSLPPSQIEELHKILAEARAIDEVVSLQAVYIGPEEAIIGAKVHPAANLTIEELAQAMDALDVAIRKAFPVIADVFLDLTMYRGSSPEPAADGASDGPTLAGDEASSTQESPPQGTRQGEP